MFDLVVNGHRTTTRRDLAPLVISWAAHALVVLAVIGLPLLFATDRLPEVPQQILTFVTVAAPPAPPSPPPPPPPPAPAAAVKPVAPRPVPTPRPIAQAPVGPPRELPPPVEAPEEGDLLAGDVDSIGGVPGGVPGGVIGGVIGGIGDVPAPPPPPPPPAPSAPVRTGGQIQAPALVKRVAPVYPPIAVNALVQGVVILEATVGRDGRVEDVEVLRSIPLLDRAAIDAVRQWVYAPLLLNGQAERFILTVTVSFSVT